MTNFFKNIFFLLFFLGCTTNTSVSDKMNKEKNEWELLNEIKDEKWNSEKIVAVLGRPNSILREGINNQEFWIYLDKNLNIQKWSIGISSEGKIHSVTFFPNISNRNLFNKENTKNYWGSSCLEKKEQINNKDFIDNIYYLDCGDGRKIYLNNLKEITSLLLVF
ncbi:MAG: hypothetical protein PHY93_20615 [Bacteriovorax sp.]|nr:hypothetical protein [Bacteriovorax sp.]